MTVCTLYPDRPDLGHWTLEADIFGNPYVQGPHRCYEVLPNDPHPAYPRLYAWLKNPQNDCLRARGDLRWQAAVIAEMRWRQPSQ